MHSTVRREVAQHTVERPIQELTRNEWVRFDLIYCNGFPTAACVAGNGRVRSLRDKQPPSRKQSPGCAREISPKREQRVKLLILRGGGNGMDNMRNRSESS